MTRVFVVLGLVIILALGFYWHSRGGDAKGLVGAIQLNNAEYVDNALARGESPNRVIGGDPLIVIAFKNPSLPNVAVTRDLIAHGADVNKRGLGGDTALMEAAMWGYEPGVSLLLKSGADANAADDDGRTALSLVGGGSSKMELTKIVQELLDDGADPCRTDKKGMSPAEHTAGISDTLAAVILNACKKRPPK